LRTVATIFFREKRTKMPLVNAGESVQKIYKDSTMRA